MRPVFFQRRSRTWTRTIKRRLWYVVLTSVRWTVLGRPISVGRIRQFSLQSRCAARPVRRSPFAAHAARSLARLRPHVESEDVGRGRGGGCDEDARPGPLYALSHPEPGEHQVHAIAGRLHAESDHHGASPSSRVWGGAAGWGARRGGAGLGGVGFEVFLLIFIEHNKP